MVIQSTAGPNGKSKKNPPKLDCKESHTEMITEEKRERKSQLRKRRNRKLNCGRCEVTYGRLARSEMALG